MNKFNVRNFVIVATTLFVFTLSTLVAVDNLFSEDSLFSEDTPTTLNQPTERPAPLPAPTTWQVQSDEIVSVKMPDGRYIQTRIIILCKGDETKVRVMLRYDPTKEL